MIQHSTHQKCAAILTGLALLAILAILKENDVRIWAWVAGS
ncbi:MAG: hypothetical protein Greene041662_533 [Candidatus Peregrinibacteria bacterium Greene0416_62]|nr:MAG: hypothetical protein Greene041662_533 [Candidatus Peregrinibacteria bacterium Greene0416_62]TSC99845.1 MAG: hypothetical protein Greene101449_484 [Candidatus Peregrinibacteria bacterium Greene1014_49]